jgi:purine-binding chemotaxis protein CheW
MTPVVVVVAAAGRRWRVPTARVREVAALGQLTPVPTAPAPLVGLTQLRGQILPVLDPAAFDASDAKARGEARAPRPGDPLLVVELGPVRAALWVDKVLGVGDGGDDGAAPLDVGALFDRLRKPA